MAFRHSTVGLVLAALMISGGCAVEQPGTQVLFGQEPGAQWLIGQWEGSISGFRPQDRPGRTLRVMSVAPDGKADARWSITADTPGGFAEAEVEGSRVKVITGANSVVELTRRTDGSLAGSVTFQSGRSFPIHLTKTVSADNLPKFEGNALSTNRGILRGEIKEALAFYETQAQQAEKDAATSGSPQRFWTIAVSAYIEAVRAGAASGQLQKAIAYGEKALDIAQRTKVPIYDVGGGLSYPPHPEIYAILVLNRAYQSVRDFDRARALLERGLALAKDVPLPRRAQSEGLLYAALGRDQFHRGEYEKAADAFLLALQSTKDWANYVGRGGNRYRYNVENSENRIVGLLSSLANTYGILGRMEEARQQYREALGYINKGGVQSLAEANLYSGLGEIDLEQKQFATALENFRRALALAQQQQTPGVISSVSRHIGDVLRGTGKPDEAISYYQASIQQTESTRSLLQSEDYRQSFFEGELNAYVSMIGVLIASDKPEEAFNYSERARSRTFLDVLGSKVQLARSGTLMEHERALQARVSVLRAMAQEQEGDAAQRAELRKQMAEAEQAYNEYLTKLRKENKEQASLMSVEPLTLKEVQERLDPGVTMLEYFVAENNIWLWVVEKDRVQFVSSSIARKDLVSKVTELRDTIYQLGERQRFNVLSQEMHKLLIQPALPHIRGQELIVVPHDVLHYLPFQALQSSEVVTSSRSIRFTTFRAPA
jgi:tetratricopeptide (TPR) repeat protein